MYRILHQPRITAARSKCRQDKKIKFEEKTTAGNCFRGFFNLVIDIFTTGFRFLEVASDSEEYVAQKRASVILQYKFTITNYNY